MKKFIYILSFLLFTVLFSSCGTVQSVKNLDSEVAGYNLKDKKEQMHRKILNKKSKSIIAVP